jgi:hypothetical protein
VATRGSGRACEAQLTCLYYDHDNEASKCVCEAALLAQGRAGSGRCTRTARGPRAHDAHAQPRAAPRRPGRAARARRSGGAARSRGAVTAVAAGFRPPGFRPTAALSARGGRPRRPPVRLGGERGRAGKGRARRGDGAGGGRAGWTGRSPPAEPAPLRPSSGAGAAGARAVAAAARAAGPSRRPAPDWRAMPPAGRLQAPRTRLGR